MVHRRPFITSSIDTTNFCSISNSSPVGDDITVGVDAIVVGVMASGRGNARAQRRVLLCVQAIGSPVAIQHGRESCAFRCMLRYCL